MIDRVISEPGMIEMIEHMFKNSDWASKRVFGKLVKKQRNPFKDNYGKYIPTDDSVLIFLNEIYMGYLLMSVEDRTEVSIVLEKGTNEQTKN